MTGDETVLEFMTGVTAPVLVPEVFSGDGEIGKEGSAGLGADEN